LRARLVAKTPFTAGRKALMVSDQTGALRAIHAPLATNRPAAASSSRP
jgi:hypothetical protein